MKRNSITPDTKPMLNRNRTLTLTALLTLTVTGCNTQPTGEVIASADLTEAQQKAINDVVAQIEAVAESFAATIDGIDEIESLSLDSQTTCPMLSLNFDADTGTTLDIDFPDGCTNEIYGDSRVSGTVTLMLSLASATIDLTFTDLAVDDRTTNGTLAASYANADAASTLAGDIDLTTTGIGQGTGSIDIIIDVATGTISIPAATLTVNPESGDSISITIAGMNIVPVANGNFIPESGTVTFDLPNDGAGPATIAIVMTFDDQSPIDRTVAVTVATADPVEYTLIAGV